MPFPIFIIGTQRSGSNLLRLMLNESDEISAPHPPHILKTFIPLLSQYGDLSLTENFHQLVSDVCEFVQKNPVEWEVPPTFEEILALCKENTLMEVMQRVYERVAIVQNKTFWCCKSMANVEFLPDIHAALPHAKYIYLYRDGRDVAVSFKKAVVGEKHIYAIAQQWKNDQEKALSFQQQCPDNQFFSFQYERFIESPKEELSRLCSFIGIEFQEKMLQYYQSKESQRTADSGEMWKNVVKPVISHNSQKFLKELSHEEIVIFETVAGTYLDALGYILVSQENERKGFSDDEIARFTRENQQLKKEIRLKISAEELQKRAGQEALIQKIQNKTT